MRLRRSATMILSITLVLVGLLSVSTAASGLAARLHPPLRGMRIVLDPGHGGIDDGTQVAGALKEKDVNLQLALVLRARLEAMGAEVLLTRETDRELSRFSQVYPGRHREDLAKRVQIIAASGCDLWISLHCNSAPGKATARGSIVYYGQQLPENAELAKAVQTRLNQINLAPFAATPRPHTAQPATYYLLRNSSTPGLLVEAGYLSNGLDCRLLTDPAWQSSFSTSLALGIVDYLQQPPAISAVAAGNRVLSLLLAVDETRPAEWCELLASPVPLTFVTEGSSLPTAELILQAGHDLLVTSADAPAVQLAAGIYRRCPAAPTASPPGLQVIAPRLSQADLAVTAVLRGETEAGLLGQLALIEQAAADRPQIVLLDCPPGAMAVLPGFLEAAASWLASAGVRPVLCADLQLINPIEP